MEKDLVLVTTGYKLSGVFRVEGELVDEWKKQGHTISMISHRGKVLLNSVKDCSLKNEDKESPITVIKYIKRFIELKKFFSQHKEATIVALSLPADCFASLFGLFVNNKVVISERNDPAQYPESKRYRLFRNFCFRLADVCIFQTEDALKFFPKSVQKKGVVIPNPINGQIPEFAIKTRNKSIIAVGRLKPQKNFPMLIRAFSMFNLKFPEYTLDIYGEGYLIDELKALAERLKVADKVEFHGFSNDIYPLMASAAMYVSSSNYEGISNSMLEALAIGVPTICTDCPVGGARQMIEDGVNGLLVPVGDDKKLFKAMCRVAEDKEFANFLAKNGHEIRKKYPVSVIASKWLSVM